MALTKRKAAPVVDRLGDIREQIKALQVEEAQIKTQLGRLFDDRKIPIVDGDDWSVQRIVATRAGALDPQLIADALKITTDELGPFKKADVTVTTFKTTRLGH